MITCVSIFKVNHLSVRVSLATYIESLRIYGCEWDKLASDYNINVKRSPWVSGWTTSMHLR